MPKRERDSKIEKAIDNALIQIGKEFTVMRRSAGWKSDEEAADKAEIDRETIARIRKGGNYDIRSFLRAIIPLGAYQTFFGRHSKSIRAFIGVRPDTTVVDTSELENLLLSYKGVNWIFRGQGHLRVLALGDFPDTTSIGTLVLGALAKSKDVIKETRTSIVIKTHNHTRLDELLNDANLAVAIAIYHTDYPNQEYITKQLEGFEKVVEVMAGDGEYDVIVVLADENVQHLEHTFNSIEKGRYQMKEVGRWFRTRIGQVY